MGTFKPLLCTFLYLLFRKLILSIFRAKHKIIFSLRNIDEEALKQLEMVTEVTKGTYKLQKGLKRTKRLWCEKLFDFSLPNFFRAKKNNNFFEPDICKKSFNFFTFFFPVKANESNCTFWCFSKISSNGNISKNVIKIIMFLLWKETILLIQSVFGARARAQHLWNYYICEVQC